MASDLLESEHDLGKLNCGHLSAFSELAGLEVLAKYAAQIAPAEKDGARPVPAAQAIFLAEMRERAGNAREPTALAYAYLVVVAVDLAIARTNATGPQRLDRLLALLLRIIGNLVMQLSTDILYDASAKCLSRGPSKRSTGGK
jgi:hypothetical protein